MMMINIAGFVPTIECLSSKLFYASRLTLQLNEEQRSKIQQFRFINNNLFENIPLMTIQILTAVSVTRQEGEIGPITVMAFSFSTLSAVIGILILISRCIPTKCGLINTSQECHKLTYKIDVKSGRMCARNHYCHKLFAKSLCQCMETNDGRIETVEIIPIVDGISCKVEISIEKDDENIEQQVQQIRDIDLLLKELMDQSCETYQDFKIV